MTPAQPVRLPSIHRQIAGCGQKPITGSRGSIRQRAIETMPASAGLDSE
jgi:hypothetical protein